MAQSLKWGILAAGTIAKRFAAGVRDSKTGSLVAVASRSLDKANTFADEFEIPTRHGSYEDLLADPGVDAVYIATPHPFHAEWAVKSAQAGKHILCEKPIGVNHPEAMLIEEAAKVNGVVAAEAFMYRSSRQTRKLVEILKAGTIGRVKTVEAEFSFKGPWNPEGRLLSAELAGGGILDVGCYPVSLARLVAGVALGQAFAEPTGVKGFAHIGETDVDEWATAVLEFPGGILATCVTGVQRNGRNHAVITGDKGRIVIPSPWFCSGEIKIEYFGGETEDASVEEDTQLWGYQADMVAELVATGNAPAPIPTMADACGNMKALDAWRNSAGFTLPHDTITSPTWPLKRAKPVAAEPTNMLYGEIEGVGKPISKLILGCDYVPNVAHMAAMADAFIEAGGNCFDTAKIYGGGRSERVVGQYLELRNMREDLVILHKDAHHPMHWPNHMVEGIDQRLEGIRSDYIDLYVMHRDNPEVPVGEFVDVLNQFKDAGKIRAFGGSNWSKERIDAANAYAAKHGKTGMALVNNNFSLAQMNDPVWRGCIASSTPDYLAWHVDNQMPNLAWSSQARGFFTDRAGPDKTGDKELVRCWYSGDNFKRRERALELAKRYGVTGLNIALAYVLRQGFPSWALIGPRNLEELRTSLPGLKVTLSPDEIAYLNLQKDSLD